MAITKPTASEVKAIMKGVDTADATVSALIDSATLMVEGCPLTGLSAERQTEIVRWVSAHLVAVYEAGGGSGVVTSEKLGDAQTNYATPQGFGEGLHSTLYGKHAMTLDTSGCLARLAKPRATVELL